jgi:probable HAF family extracellular repeat protein
MKRSSLYWLALPVLALAFGCEQATAPAAPDRLVAVNAAASPSYTAIDLGSLGSGMAIATGINNRGQIAGYSWTAPVWGIHAFLWQKGEMIDLGAFDGAETYAFDINDRGQIVGSGGSDRIFLWEQGQFIDLGSLGGWQKLASAVNNRGQIVGYSATSSGPIHAFLWENGVMTDLGTLGGSFSVAWAINDRGQVVGSSQNSSGESHAFLWEKGAMIDLGTPGQPSSASGINDQGQIVGYSETVSGSTHAVLWAEGKMIDLGASPGTQVSYATSITNNGTIVGWCHTPGPQRGCIWDAKNVGNVVDLGSQLIDVNEVGQVVGRGGTLWQARLWQPGNRRSVLLP